MKRLITIFIMVITIFVFTSCKNPDADYVPQETTVETTTKTKPSPFEVVDEYTKNESDTDNSKYGELHD